MDHASSDAVWLTMGGSGGSRIFGAVAQTLLNLDWGHDLASAVELPRVHHQLLPEYVSRPSFPLSTCVFVAVVDRRARARGRSTA